ncbi:major capsid protein [Pseudomonas aeruginosa]|uniref:major capsid protein n=1 Tax=Pseudomonas aeruginosa TaxID=287 RepID=UPI00249CA10D|nr:major capsid protein [Pseudomonas aeruginosa]WGW23301.1 major capsid protein [Pseudomonas aeruginosa]WGW84843.1 major capsid protein [Pseudomonas aeruginosa]
MAFDLAVFNKQTYTALTETVAQAIDKFNQASAGTIVLQNAPAQGDFDIKASFKLIANLVRRRNVYGNGDVAATRLTQLLNAAVKVAAGTPPIEYEAAQYNWVLQNPALAAPDHR